MIKLHVQSEIYSIINAFACGLLETKILSELWILDHPASCSWRRNNMLIRFDWTLLVVVFLTSLFASSEWLR